MPSFRTISLFFIATLATFTLAAPVNTPPTDVYNQGDNSSCGKGCSPLIILTKLNTDIKPISALVEVKVDTVKPLVAGVVVAVDKAAAELQVLDDTKVAVNIKIDVVAKVVVSVVASVVACMQIALKLAAVEPA
ncbi:hypothetical protein PM082_022835 [Marasmius tenuissimus]|nr:hypothetical protein PM082_022835 [Marasmius tenuissimus]